MGFIALGVALTMLGLGLLMEHNGRKARREGSGYPK